MTNLRDLHSDILGRIIRHMDGPTLAAASCSDPLLRSLAADPLLWHDLCLSRWPSLRHPRLLPLLTDPQRFFSETAPFPISDFSAAMGPTTICYDEKNVSGDDGGDLPAEIISAIDIYHKGMPIFSRVIETDTSSSWFLTWPLRIDGLERKEPDHMVGPNHKQAMDLKELTLSWTVIDPATGQAVNLSSRHPVSVDRHWYTSETLVRFGLVIGGCAVNVVVTCEEETGHVREVVLTVENLDGRTVSGRDGLGVIKMAMEGGRRGAQWEEEIMRNHKEFLRRKRERRERKVRREGILDLCCTAIGALMFLIFIRLMFFR